MQSAQELYHFILEQLKTPRGIIAMLITAVLLAGILIMGVNCAAIPNLDGVIDIHVELDREGDDEKEIHTPKGE